MSTTEELNENPENIIPQPQITNPNEERSLRDMLAETISSMNTMLTKIASLPQFQPNPNYTSTNASQNAIPTNLGPEQPGQHLETPILIPNHDQIKSVSTSRSEQSPTSLEFDPLKSRIDKVEAELTKIRVGCTRSVSFRDLCPFPDVVLPESFKLPEFEKYSGEGCPVSHLRAYCGDMVTVRSNDQLLVRYFQKSLTGPALKWFTSLDLSNITLFDHLSNLFVDQYSYNLDMKPRREDLESLRQNKDEPCVTYVGRWHSMAARVKPKPTDEKFINMIIKSSLPTISSYLAIQ